MSEPDIPVIKPADIPAAIGLLSRLPVHSDATRGAASAWAFPIVGIIIGGLAAATGWALVAVGVPANLTAAVVLAVMIGTTGALHEDGLADTVDGLWGGWDKVRRLEIMKDSHIGAYGVIALVLSLILRWAALAALINADMFIASLIAVATLSRLPMVVLMAVMPHARRDGLSASVGRVGPLPALIAVGIAALTGVALLGWTGLLVLAAVAIAGLITARIAHIKIGGQTGDILGASQQIAEIAALMALATVLI